MLSILIPSMNYNVSPLVRKLHADFTKTGIPFEIIVADDDPKSQQGIAYETLCELEGVRAFINPKNVGRWQNRRMMAEQAQYKQLLLLDEDVLPASEDFAAQWAKIADRDEVVSGGRIYSADKPESAEQFLRWKYGRKREMKKAEIRNQTPYAQLTTCNLKIPRSVMLQLPTHPELSGYGHEDSMMGYDLKYAFVAVRHIDNPIVHTQIDDTAVFLRKTKEGVENLHRLIQSGKIDEMIRLYRYFSRMKKRKLIAVLSGIYKNQHRSMEQRLASANAPLRLFDFYKLCYLAYLERSQNKTGLVKK